MTTGIPTTNKGYLQAAAYYADPNNELIPDETHHEYVKGVHAWMLATGIPAGGGGGGDVTADEFLNLKQAVGIQAIQQAIATGTTVTSSYNYAVDEYEDETGVSASVATYEPSTDSYRTTTASTHSLLVQSEESGTVTDGSQYFYDASGNIKAPLTANGNAQTEIPVLDSPYADDSSLGIEFDGTGDYVSAPDSADWELGVSQDPFTIEAWVKSPTLSSGTEVIATHGTNSGGVGWEFYCRLGEIRFTVDGATTVYETNNANLVDDTWTHLTAEYDGTTLRIYQGDTVLTGYTSATNIDISPSTAPLNVGRRSDSVGGDFIGSMTDVRIFKGTALYSGSKTTPTTSPTFSTEDLFVWGSTSTGNIEDQAGKTLTLTGNVNVVASPYGGTEPVLLLDGANDVVSFPASGIGDFGSGAFSIFGWIKPDIVTGLQSIVAAYLASTDWYFGITGTDMIFRHNSTNHITSTLTVQANVWQRIGVTYDGVSDLVFHLDSSSETETTSGSVTNQASIYIGTFPNLSSDFDGEIADIQIFKGSVETYSVPTSKPAVTTEDFYLDHDITNTTFSDATTTHTPVANGDVRHSRAHSKFGATAIRFDGAGDSITVADSTDFEFGAGSFTVDTFVSFDALGSAECLIQKGNNATSNMEWKLSKTSGNEIQFDHSTSGTAYATPVTTTSAGLVADTMHHVRVVGDGAGGITIYVDGTSRGTGSYGTIATSTVGLRIGENAAGTEDLAGYLEEVSVAKTVERTSTVPTEPYSLTANNFELESITFTAGANPTKATMVVVMEPIDSMTINTDLIGYVSPTASFANKGTFTLTLAGVEPLSGGNIYVSNDLDISGLTSGTDLRYYLRGANSKDFRIHATYLYYAD